MRHFTIVVLIIFSVQTLQCQQVSNARFNQSGKQIAVTYDLEGDESTVYDISLFYSINEGSWQGPVRSVTGNVGTGQKAGNGKQITWEVLNDMDKLTGEISIKVQAEVVSIGRSGVTNGTFTDSRDGHVYKQVTIGNQTWMTENLAYLPAVSPSSGGSDTKPYYYVYGYKGTNISAAKATANYGTYGVLYNWPAAQTACPPCWHLPTDEEWKILTDYLTSHGYGYGENGADISKSMASTSGWKSSSTSGTIGNDYGSNNSSGFTALPSGFRLSVGDFYFLGLTTYFWSSSEGDMSTAWGRLLTSGGDGVCRYDYDREGGFSVRCLQNK